MHALGGGGGGVFSRLELFEDLGEFGVGSIGARALAAEVVGDARGLAAGLGGGGELDGARHRELGLGGGGGGFLGGGELGGGLGGGALGDGARGLSLLGAREKLVVSASILLPFFTAPASLARYDSAFSSAARVAASWSLIASVEIEHGGPRAEGCATEGAEERARISTRSRYRRLVHRRTKTWTHHFTARSDADPLRVLRRRASRARAPRRDAGLARVTYTRVDPRAPRFQRDAPRRRSSRRSRDGQHGSASVCTRRVASLPPATESSSTAATPRVAAARERVESVAASGGGVAGAYVRDFASLDDVRGLAHDILDAHPRLHLLDNNAGVFMPKRVVTPDGFESTFQINVLAPYLLTGFLLPRLVDTVATSADADVRVLNVASISQLPSVEWDNLNAERRFTDHTSCCHSKTMMKLFSFELHERLARRGGDEAKVVALTCDPGTVNTKMLLAGWGPCGIETHQANDQYELLTGEAFRGEAHRGGYHVNLACRSMPGETNREERERL